MSLLLVAEESILTPLSRTVPPLSMHALQIACTKETKNTMRDFIVELLLWHGASISVEGETTRLVELTFKAGNLATAAIVEQWKTDGQGKGPFCECSWFVKISKADPRRSQKLNWPSLCS